MPQRAGSGCCRRAGVALVDRIGAELKINLDAALLNLVYLLHYGRVSERFKELVLKTSDTATYRGFESHPFRQSCEGASIENNGCAFFVSASEAAKLGLLAILCEL